MKKIIYLGIFLGALAMANPVLADNASSTTNLECARDAALVREGSIDAAFLVFYNSMDDALEQRRTGLSSAWLLTTKEARKTARKSVTNAFKNARESAREAYKDAKESAWDRFKLTLKAECKIKKSEESSSITDPI